MPVELGKGPVVVYKDSWTHYDRRVINRIIDVAEAKKITVAENDLSRLRQRWRRPDSAGIPAALLGISTRYTHAPFEMGDERDVIAALELLKAFVTKPAEPLALGPS